MDTNTQQHTRTLYDTPTVPWIIIGACLALSFIDMLLLSNAIEKLSGSGQAAASLMAFFFALVGNLTAFLWGRSQGINNVRKKWSFFEPWIWIIFGLIFIVIRVIVIITDVQAYPDEALEIISSESVMALILMVLYVGTGLTLQHESKKIFDPSNYLEWRILKDAKKKQHAVAKKYAEAERLILELENFSKYYLSIKKQYFIHRNALYDAERTTLSSVVKQILEDNPRLDPQVVEDILQSVLADRPHVAKESIVPSRPTSMSPMTRNRTANAPISRKKII